MKARGFRSVLCPIDFSDHSRLALRYAEAVARRSRGALTVLYVNDPLLVAAAATALNDHEFVNTSATELQRFIDDSLPRRTRTASRVTPLVVVGEPDSQILKTGDRIAADLIVLGTHGLTGVDRAILGSTTRRILGRTSVPILAVPRVAAEPDARSWPGRRIAAAIELDRLAQRDIDTAVGVARWFRCSLSLLHVIDPIPSPPWIRGDLAAAEASRIADAKARLQKLAPAGRGRVPSTVDVAVGRAADDISALAAATGARLLTTALRDRQHWLDPKRGSITYEMLTRVRMPILACPANWRIS